MNEAEKARKAQQRADRDKQLDDIGRSLDRASKLIEDSQREIERSRGLMQERRDRDRRDDQAEDMQGGPSARTRKAPPDFAYA